MKRMGKKTVMMLFIVLSAIFHPLTLRASASPSDFQVLQTFWGSTSNPLEAGPGDMAVPFNVIIQNIGKQAYSGLDALLYLQAPFSTFMGENVAQGYYAGSIPVGQTATLQFQLNIDASASIGSYSMIMSLRYGSGFAYGETLTVPILLLGRVELKVSVNPPSLSPGSINTLMVDVSNRGTGYASKVSVTLNFPSGLSVIGDNQRYFPSITPNENKTIILDAYAQPSLAGSSLQIGATITYLDAYGTSRAVNLVAGLRISSIANVPLVVTVGGEALQPGMLNTITLNILNNQAKPVSFVQASLILPSGSLVISGDNNWFFPYIDPFKSVTFNAKLMVSSSAANTNYQLTLTLSYLDPSNLSRTENHIFGVQVLPTPRDVLIVSLEGNVLRAGLFNEPKITIFNSGKAPLRSITATLSLPTAPGATTSGASIVLSRGNQWYFDILQPNSNVTFSPEIFAALGAVDTSYQTQLSISYADENEANRVETKSVGFLVKGFIYIQVQDVQISPSSVTPSGNITIIGNLLNRGNAPGMYVTVDTKSESPYISSGTQYIGDVSTNTITPFSITAQVDRRAQNGTYPIIITVSYSDNYNVTSSITYSTSVVVSTSQSQIPATQPQSQTLILGMTPVGLLFFMIITMLIIITTAVFWRNRRTMRQKSDLETRAAYQYQVSSISRQKVRINA